jgi:hypothetical protein
MKLLMLLILVVIGCKASVETIPPVQKDSTLKMLTYGLPSMEGERVRDAVAKKYGFKYFAVAGCLVTGELLDSVHKENEKVKAVLRDRLGKNWEEDFRKEVDKLMVKQEQVFKLVKMRPDIITREKELNRTDKYLDFSIDYGKNPNSFYITAIENEYEQSKFREIIFKKFLIDLNSNSLTTIELTN